MEVDLNEYNLETKFLLLLAFTVFLSSFYVFFTPGKYLMPSFLGLAAIFLLMARQKSSKYQIEQSKFQRYMEFLGMFVAIYSAVASTVIAGAS